MTAVEVVLVVNPAARNVSPEATSATVDRWGREHQLTVVHSRRDDPELGAVRAVLPAAGAVAVLSGDGLLNRVANVMADATCDAALVPLPGGTTNVVARSLGMSRSLPVANEQALTALASGATARRGWGRLNDRGFLANAGIGLDAAVVAEVESRPRAKQRFGHLWFAVAAVRELAGPARRVRLMREPAPGPHEAFWVVAMASHPFSFAGPRPLELLPPTAAWGDGIWLMSFPPMRLGRLARLGTRVLMTSRGITSADGVELRKLTTQASFVSSIRVQSQVDGEHLPATERFVFRWQPDALRLVDIRPAAAGTA